jgi:hypothetical protein
MKKILFAFTAVATLSFAFTTFNDVLPIGAAIPKPELKAEGYFRQRNFPEGCEEEKWIARDV